MAKDSIYECTYYTSKGLAHGTVYLRFISMHRAVASAKHKLLSVQVEFVFDDVALVSSLHTGALYLIRKTENTP